MWVNFFLARRYLFRGKAKHISFIAIIACLGVALGVGTLLVVVSVMNGFDKDLMERLLKFNYHLTLESKDENYLRDLKEKLSSWKEIETISFFIQTQVFCLENNFFVPLMVKGINFDDEKEKNFFLQYLKEDYKREGVFIGEALKKRFLFQEKLKILPLDNLLEEPVNELIAGVFKLGIYDIDNNYIISSIEKVKNWTDLYLVYLGIRIKNPFFADKLKEKIEEEFPGVLINTWTENNRILFSALKLEKIVMFIILSLIILVASFNIFATLTVKVVEKTKDIGILKALGFSQESILFIFSLQGLILGIVGVILGLSFGSILCFILKKYPFIKLPQEIYAIEYLPVALNLRDVILIAFLGVLLSLASSIFPAKRASLLSASEALRYE